MFFNLSEAQTGKRLIGRFLPSPPQHKHTHTLLYSLGIQWKWEVENCWIHDCTWKDSTFHRPLGYLATEYVLENYTTPMGILLKLSLESNFQINSKLSSFSSNLVIPRCFVSYLYFWHMCQTIILYPFKGIYSYSALVRLLFFFHQRVREDMERSGFLYFSLHFTGLDEGRSHIFIYDFSLH